MNLISSLVKMGMRNTLKFIIFKKKKKKYLSITRGKISHHTFLIFIFLRGSWICSKSMKFGTKVLAVRSVYLKKPLYKYQLKVTKS